MRYSKTCRKRGRWKPCIWHFLFIAQKNVVSQTVCHRKISLEDSFCSRRLEQIKMNHNQPICERNITYPHAALTSPWPWLKTKHTSVFVSASLSGSEGEEEARTAAAAVINALWWVSRPRSGFVFFRRLIQLQLRSTAPQVSYGNADAKSGSIICSRW